MSSSRFVIAILAIALCLSEVVVDVESFSNTFTTKSSQPYTHNTFTFSSPSRNRGKGNKLLPFSTLLATPELRSEERSSYANYNETSVDTSISVADIERAWAMETAGIASQADDLASTSSIDIEQSPVINLMSVDFLGPIACITFVIAFLINTLVNSGGISDTFLTMDLSQKMQVLGKISWFPGQVEEAQLVVGLVMAFSSFAQALTGFGFAVVAVGAMSSMPWLLHSELYDVITPVAATLGALVGFILLIPYAFAKGPKTEAEPGLEWNEILPLLIPCTVLTPLGVQLNSMVDPIIGTRILAALIMGFVGYKLVPTIQDALQTNDDADDLIADDEASSSPEFLRSKTAAVVLGSAAGIFGGAFDVQGPPLCVYGDAKGWSPAQFRNNVLAVVCLNSAFVVAIDAFQGHLGDFYYSYFCLTSLPGVLMGIVAGQYASKRIDPVLFKNLVLVMCLGLGIQLLTVA